MRGIVAKKLRRMARKGTKPTGYKTTWFERLTGKTDGEGKSIKDIRGTVTCTGYRRFYQDLKATHKRIRRAT